MAAIQRVGREIKDGQCGNLDIHALEEDIFLSFHKGVDSENLVPSHNSVERGSMLGKGEGFGENISEFSIKIIENRWGLKELMLVGIKELMLIRNMDLE